MNCPITSRLGLCSWSLQPESAADLFDKVSATGIRRIQVALDPIREKRPGWEDFMPACERAGIECISGMFGTIGEDYSTLESIRRTGGVVPDAHWEENWKNIQATAGLAHDMGLTQITFHAGFLPHDPRDPDYDKLRGRIMLIADVFAAKAITLCCETGQEDADTLKAFLEHLARPNVGVNFDPANMILYDKGDPIRALRTLGPWLKSCHIKDAHKTKTPGTWGEEVVVGTGEVNWREFLGALNELGFTGNCCIEREAGTQRVADIKTAKAYVEGLAAAA